jgi:hypothetical protein
MVRNDQHSAAESWGSRSGSRRAASGWYPGRNHAESVSASDGTRYCLGAGNADWKSNSPRHRSETVARLPTLLSLVTNASLATQWPYLVTLGGLGAGYWVAG